MRSTLTQLCTSSNPSFSAVTVKWTQAIIDEINAAIAGCQCGPIVFNVPTQTSDTTTNLGTLYQSINRIYYIDPTTLQLVPALCAGNTATIVADPATGDSNYIAAQWTIPVDCNGQMNYSGAQLPPSSTSSDRSALRRRE